MFSTSRCLLWIGISVFLLAIIIPFITQPPSPFEVAAKQQTLNPNKNKRPSTVQFADETLSWNLQFTHAQTTDNLTSITESLGSGACVLDYNNDGFMDLFFVGGNGHTYYYGQKSWWSKTDYSALYHNVKGQYFENVSEKAKLTASLWGMGCAAGDIDNDGNTDLLITALGDNKLYRNKGDGTFEDITTKAKINEPAIANKWSTSAAMADFNNDGWLDIYVGNYIHYKKNAVTMENQTGYQVSQEVAFDATLYDAQPNQLLKNNGDLTFTNIAQAAGVDESTGRTLSVAWLYANDDNWLDLLITNDKGSPSHLLLNDSGERFNEAGLDFRVKTATSKRSAAIGDIDNDQDLDIVLAAPLGEAPLVLVRGNHATLNSENTKQDSFRDLTWDAGVAQEYNLSLSTWGNNLVDFNNDGWLDLFNGNGMLTPDPDSHYLPQGQPNRLWVNRGDGTFIYNPFSNESLSSRGSVTIDANNDGQQDLVLTHNNDTAKLLINNTKTNHHWLTLNLINKKGNHSAIGARISITTKAGTFYRDASSQFSFLSQSDPRISIGLGAETIVEKLVVTWPDGSTSTYKDIAANQHIQLSQNNSDIKILNKSSATNIAVIPAPFDQYPLNYAAWLINSDLAIDGQLQLFHIYQKANQTEKLQLLNAMRGKQKPAFLPVIHNALSDASDEIKITAITLLQDYELENSIAWLIDILQTGSPEAICQTAKTAQFFFREEEAVTHRKMLLTPHLVRLLEHENSHIANCAARALAEAEAFRANLPLITHLNSSAEPVRIQTIRTLGWLREGLAKEPLRNVINNPKESPLVKAHALVALIRINDEHTDAYLDQLLTVNDAQSVADVSKMAQFFLTDKDDGIVVNNTAVINHLQTLAKNSSIDSTDYTTIIAFLDALAATRQKQFVPFITHYTQSNNSDIRLKAYQALIENASPEALTQAQAGLFDKDDQIQQTITKIFLDKNLIIAKATINKLLATDMPRALDLMQISHEETAQKTINTILKKPNNDTLLTKALNACMRLNNIKINVPLALIENTDESIKISALQCAKAQSFYGMDITQLDPIFTAALKDDSKISHTIAEALASYNNIWSRKIIDAYIASDTTHEATLNALFAALNEQHAESYLPTFVAALQNKNTAIKKAAIKHVTNFADNAQINNLLWGIFINQTEPADIRVLAADQLSTKRANDIIAEVNKNNGR